MGPHWILLAALATASPQSGSVSGDEPAFEATDGELQPPDQPAAVKPGDPQPLAAPPPKKEQSESPVALQAGLISAGIIATCFAIGAVSWWLDVGTTSFGLKNTGSFGRHTYAGGADKAGHVAGSYGGAIVFAQAYQWVGVPRETAIWFGVLLSGIIANGVEVIDGFTPHQFEFGDALANTLGVAAAALVLLVPEIYEVLGFRINYVPSPRFIKGPKSYMKLINDYSGQMYYVDIKLGGALEAAGVRPGIGRYLLVGGVFGTWDYAPGGPEQGRRRNWGVQMSLAPAAIVEDFAPPGWATNGAVNFLTYFSVPFLSVALMRDWNSGRYYLNFGISNRLEVPL